jgi:hypothetical protein
MNWFTLLVGTTQMAAADHALRRAACSASTSRRESRT